MARLSLKFLGSFEAQLDGQTLRAFESSKVRALLAYLAVESDRAHSRSSLTGLFWPEHPERRARASLGQAIYNLRKLLGEQAPKNPSRETHSGVVPILLVERETLQLNPNADIWVDVKAFDQSIRDCKLHVRLDSSYCEDCMPRLEQAVGLYRGNFLVGLHLKGCASFEEWMRAEEQRLEQMAVWALNELAECHLQRGALDSALNLTRRQLEIDLYQEPAHRQLMRLLALKGQRNSAIAHYDYVCQLLEEELGVLPEQATISLAERVKNEEGFSPEQVASTHNLPAIVVPLVGRKREIGEIRQHLLDPYCRLLTLVGQGGVARPTWRSMWPVAW